MADGNDTPATGVVQQSNVDPSDALGEAGLRALQAERKRAREAEQKLRALQKELDELRENYAPKSDIQKVLDKLNAAEQRAAQAERRALLGEVVAETGLTMKQAERLKGDTIDDLIQDAEEVFGIGREKAQEGQQFQPQQERQSTQSAPVRPPREKLTPNPGETKEPDEMDPRKLAAMIPRN
jgi:hypothetical protein